MVSKQFLLFRSQVHPPNGILETETSQLFHILSTDFSAFEQKFSKRMTIRNATQKSINLSSRYRQYGAGNCESLN